RRNVDVELPSNLKQPVAREFPKQVLLGRHRLVKCLHWGGHVLRIQYRRNPWSILETAAPGNERESTGRWGELRHDATLSRLRHAKSGACVAVYSIRFDRSRRRDSIAVGNPTAAETRRDAEASIRLR